MSSAQQNDPLLVITMSLDAAEQFKSALSYAASVLETHAETVTPGVAEAVLEHAGWLTWGRSRVHGAELDAS